MKLKCKAEIKEKKKTFIKLKGAFLFFIEDLLKKVTKKKKKIQDLPEFPLGYGKLKFINL